MQPTQMPITPTVVTSNMNVNATTNDSDGAYVGTIATTNRGNNNGDDSDSDENDSLGMRISQSMMNNLVMVMLGFTFLL